MFVLADEPLPAAGVLYRAGALYGHVKTRKFGNLEKDFTFAPVLTTSLIKKG